MTSSTISNVTAAAAKSPAVAGHTTRLYISPWTPLLLSTYLSESLQKVVTAVEFHSLETFPERSFGYFELPVDDAVKLKQKLHGAFLKGMKLRVEDARPDSKKRRVESEVEENRNGEEAGVHSSSRRSKRNKKEQGVLPGVEIESGRHVKRAWKTSESESKGEKKSKSSRKSDKEPKGDLVFRANMSSNAANIAAQRNDKEEKSKKRKRDGKSKRVTEVKEFENNTKYPTFLRDSGSTGGKDAGNVSYEDGKGWVDEGGNVVDDYIPPVTNKGKSPTPAVPVQGPDDEASHLVAEDIAVSKEKTPDVVVPTQTATLADKASSPALDPPEKPVHPLEAIFKQPAPKTTNGKGRKKPKFVVPSPIDTSFSFFGDRPDDDDEDQEGGEGSSLPMPPATPFTRRDMENRGIRSAAPTPDTAAIGKRFIPWAAEDDEDEDEQDDSKGDQAQEPDRRDRSASLSKRHSPTPTPGQITDTAAGGDGGQNDFEKHFYEHRGEYNRHWKQRKRESRKAVRQSENRKRGNQA